ncbi:MAG TPA: TRAP transporter substrate-binding protein [Methylomirabilota bacterium]|nr:TRAP transporter substrate-binding protein [Methylomirabilota bacterium]
MRRIALVAAIGMTAVAGAWAPPAPAQDVIKLKLSHFLPATHNHHVNVIVPWVEAVKRKTNGRVEITVFPTASLCKPLQQYECARDGIADIAWAVTGWTPNRFPLSSVLELPFMHRTAATGSQMLAELWDGYLAKEWDDVHLLTMNVHPAGHIHTSSKPIRTLEDFRGMKIRTPTAVVGDLLDMLGATKVGMPANAIYEAVANGVVDGFGMPYEALPSFKLHEVSKYHTEVGMYTTVFAMTMNRKRWESLPADVRRVLDETTSPKSGVWKRIGESWDRAEIVGRKAVVERKSEIYVLPRDERRRWREAVRGLDDKWAADVDKRGLPGRALLKEARALSGKSGEAD